jgi:hypothetical protein
VRFPYVELPGERRSLPRPALPVQVELEHLFHLCLLDSGSVANRLPAELAAEAGLSLDDALETDRIAIAGLLTNGRLLGVDLSVGAFQFDAPVWFCEPWPFDFGLLGQEGFFRFFRITFCAAEGWLELVPEAETVAT